MEALGLLDTVLHARTLSCSAQLQAVALLHPSKTSRQDKTRGSCVCASVHVPGCEL